MKISLNWINDYLDTSLDHQYISDSLTDLGLENTYVSVGKSFDNVVVGKIIQCVNHENSNHLSVCTVDVGQEKPLNIVCGAPNVKKNINVPVAIIGATLDWGSFKIKKTKIRGEVSMGMICSEKELGLSDSHEGILVIDSNCKIGQSFSELIEINNDIIFDIDLTPNRGDCLSHLGVAREIALIEQKKINQTRDAFLLDDEYMDDSPISISIDDTNECPKYQVRVIKNINVGKSPDWLVHRLKLIGQKSVNNVVDIANYIMFDLGQPLHAFDYDKILNNKIRVHKSKGGENVSLLDGSSIELKKSNIVISDDSNIIAIAGIMGCQNSSVSTKTKNIIIESAIFDPILIRKGSKGLGISTEASKRFERGVDSKCVGLALDKMAKLVVESCGGHIHSRQISINSISEEKNIEFRLIKCNKLLGTSLDSKKIENYLESLNIKYSVKSNEVYSCCPPSYRGDIEREVDLIEEIARMIGYNNIPESNKFTIPAKSLLDRNLEINNIVKSILSNMGFNEHYSNSLINFEQTKHFNNDIPVKILNPLSSDMEYVRNSMIPGLLKAVSYNENRQNDYFRLFEVGSISNYNEKKYNLSNERDVLCMAFYGKSIRSWKKKNDLDLYEVKSKVSLFFEKIGLMNIRYKQATYANSNVCIEIFSKKKKIGSILVPNQKMKKYYRIKGSLFIVDVELEKVDFNYRDYKVISVNKYPTSKRDISISVSKKIRAEELIKTIKVSSERFLKDIRLVDIYISEDLNDGDIGLSFALTFQSPSHTMKDEEVDKEVNLILNSLKRKFKTIQR